VSRPSGWIVGEVRKVDLDDGTIALSHGKIAPWKMGPMESMVFQAREAGSISGFKVGDKIKFRAGWVRQQPTVVQINPAIK
jgi:Cu/Ag efflux protein CusF